MLKLSVKDLNPFLTCTLCNGYFREAHTIPECMHRFCKTCIMRHFAEKNLRGTISCPTCNLKLGTFTSNKIIYDRNLQSIIDEILPQFAADEKLAEQNYYIEKGLKRKYEEEVAANESKARAESGKATRDADLENEEVTIKLVPVINKDTTVEILSALKKPTFRSDLKIKVSKVQRFIHKRLSEDLTSKVTQEDIEVLCGDRELEKDQDLTVILNYVTESNPSIVTTNGVESKVYLLNYRLKQ